MKILIDTNVINSVFNPNSTKHPEYKPVLSCLIDPDKSGIMVYGGTRYKKELI